MSIQNILLTERYRPATLDDLIIPDRIRTKLSEGVYQHLLFYGSPGTGKTSAAKALCTQFGHDYRYINASDETSVDVIREKITKFCTTASLTSIEGRLKIVILDEIDGVSDQFNKALKATMDSFSKNTRFIATTNHINKIPEAVLSRFEQINFDFTKDEEVEQLKSYMKRVYEIVKKEGSDIEKPALLELVKRKFPDMRNTLTVLQGYIAEGKTLITIDDVKKFHGIYKDVYELIFNSIDPVENYKLLISQYSNRVDDVLASLGADFIEYIRLEKPQFAKFIPQIIITVAEHQAQRTLVIDQAITMLSCVYSIQSIVNTNNLQ
jgi:DNA polymerase III delta prime subunit